MAEGWRRGNATGQVVVVLLLVTTAWAFVPDSQLAYVRAFLGPDVAVDVTYATRMGEQIREVLPDRSLIDQNSETVSHAKISAHQRTLTLKGGEVIVDVARNPRIPFVIHKDDYSIRTHAGAVWVRSMPADALRVGVLRDSAEVRRDSGGIGSVSLHAGDVATFSPGSVRLEPVSLEDLPRLTAWRRSEIWLSANTLADAAVEFNRYSTRKLVVKDQWTASMRISGRFYASDVEKFVKALEPLRVSSRSLPHGPRGQDVILLSRS